MKIIYYSTAYYASHGGSNHSKSFVECASRNTDVQELSVFPAMGMIKKPMVQSVVAGGTLATILRKSGFAAIFRFFRRSKFYLNELVNEIEKLKPDAIVIRLDSNFVQVRKLKQKFPTLIVVTEVNASPFDESFKRISFRPFFRALERRHLSRADVNFFVSKTLRSKIMKSRSSDQRDLLLINGVDTSLFSPTRDKRKSKRDLALPEHKKIVGYVGTLDIMKRMDVLLEAFNRLHAVRTDIYFVIIGDGPEFNNVREQRNRDGLQDCLLLTGNIPHNTVPAYLQAFDLAIHHAANDYMCPLKLFEYLAAGVPVIGPNTPAVKEVFEEGKHLFLCQPEATDIVQKIISCLDNLPQLDEMIQNGMALVKEKYTWQRNADTVISTIKSRMSQ